jgi:hypothetical protein
MGPCGSGSWPVLHQPAPSVAASSARATHAATRRPPPVSTNPPLRRCVRCPRHATNNTHSTIPSSPIRPLRRCVRCPRHATSDTLTVTPSPTTCLHHGYVGPQCRDQQQPYHHPLSAHLSPPWPRRVPRRATSTTLSVIPFSANLLPPRLCRVSAPRDRQCLTAIHFSTKPPPPVVASGARAARTTTRCPPSPSPPSRLPRGCVGCPRRANNNALTTPPLQQSTSPWLRRTPTPHDQQQPDLPHSTHLPRGCVGCPRRATNNALFTIPFRLQSCLRGKGCASQVDGWRGWAAWVGWGRVFTAALEGEGVGVTGMVRVGGAGWKALF